MATDLLLKCVSVIFGGQHTCIYGLFLDTWPTPLPGQLGGRQHQLQPSAQRCPQQDLAPMLGLLMIVTLAGHWKLSTVHTGGCVTLWWGLDVLYARAHVAPSLDSIF